MGTTIVLALYADSPVIAVMVENLCVCVCECVRACVCVFVCVFAYPREQMQLATGWSP